eukprot:TRINITY_DN5125_c0_g1_i1.p1 TRINITY_DN5125_c0_g1~~TRINITY_DN5125_c0_g1_i1.p1  ORF type:complete len:336 (-),score=110.39 TRINITY_DN5125_c0_g1_i1:72-1079(-)
MSDNESMHSEDEDQEFQPSLDISALPVVVKNRVKALKKLQFETVKAEAEYYKEIHSLDVKYQKLYDAINVKRTGVIKGEHEPAGDEIDWPSDEEDEDAEKKPEDLANGVEKMKLEDYDENTKGIPKFWLHTLKNANEEALMGLIEPHDEPVLEHLTDITVSLNEPKNTGFTLTFHFSPNPYFTNLTLTKEYELRDGPDPESPLEYDGPEIFRCKGCKIEWKEGKDVTQKTVKIKKIKARKGATGSPEKTVTKEIAADSFFSFFSPPDVPEDPKAEVSDDNRAILAIDFDVGFAIKEKIITRAVLYFTGDLFEDDDEFEDCDTEEEDDEDDEEGEK